MTTARLVSLSVLTCAGALAVACGSSSDTSGGTGNGNGNPGGVGNINRGGGLIEGSTPNYGPGFEKCAGINSGFEGDEYCIAAPDPSIGMQVHYGPSSYTDKAEVDKYIIHPG